MNPEGGAFTHMMRKSTTDWRAAVRGGAYPVAFAAKLTETTTVRVASWFRATDTSHLPPALMTSIEPIGGQIVMPFLALVEARFVARFRKHGLSLQTIRKVAQKLREKHSLDHPFATQRRFRTDGKRIMMEEAVDDERRLLDIMTDEWAFPNVVEPSLFKTVVYMDDLAVRITPFTEFPSIIVDPRFALGQPVAEPGNVPTSTLAAAFIAEGDVEAVADWYGTNVAAVTQSVAFEQLLAA